MVTHLSVLSLFPFVSPPFLTLDHYVTGYWTGDTALTSSTTPYQCVTPYETIAPGNYLVPGYEGNKSSPGNQHCHEITSSLPFHLP
jgi:hypothetical protein